MADKNVLKELSDDDDDDDVNNCYLNRLNSFQRAKSLDGGGSPSHSSSFLSNSFIKASLHGEMYEKSYSHNDGLMSTSKQRQFDFPPESAPYSRMSSASGKYGDKYYYI